VKVIMRNPWRKVWGQPFILGTLLLCLLPSYGYAANEQISLQLKWKHQFQFAGYYTALEKGYYRDAGLDVTLIEGGPGRSSIEHVVNEQAAYGITSTGALIERSRGKAVKALGAIFQHSPLVLLVKKDSGFKKIADLRGKRIMLQRDYQNAGIVAALKEAGIHEKDFILQDISYDIQDLITGKTDAFAAYVTDQPHQLKRLGVPYRIFYPKNQGVDFYGDIVITSDAEIRKHPQRVRAFMQATERGWNDALEHIDEAIDLILLKYNTQHLSREQLLFEARQSAELIMQNVVNIGYMNRYRWQRIAQAYTEQGLLPANYPVSEFLYQPEPSIMKVIRNNLWWLGLLLLSVLALHIVILRRTVRHRTEALKNERKILLTGERFASDQQQILIKTLDSSVPLSEVLDDLVCAIQRHMPGMLGSILLLDEAGKYLIHGAAPDLPTAYCKAIDGVKIGPCVGSCGTAAYRKERVIVADIATDPLWADYKELALQHGLAACWSQPIKDADELVLGTFAMYHRQPCAPEARDILLIERAGALAANVIRRRRDEQETLRLAAILEVSPDFVAMFDVNGKTTFVNKAGRKIMGFGEDEDLSGLSIADYHPPEVAQHLTENALPVLRDAGGLWHGQTVFLSRNGREYITDQVLLAHRDKTGGITHYATVARDISKRITAEQERQQMQSQMEHAQRLESLGVLAGGIAHDFNNILTAIMGNAAMAERKALKNPHDMPKYLGNIVESSEKAAELCKQMLAYSGKGRFVVKAIDLSEMVESITKLLGISIAKGVVLKYHLTEQLPAVEADVAQLQQVIMNLVINASDAIGEKSGVISIATGVMQADSAYLTGTSLDDHLPAGRYVYLEISDTGCGMDKNTQAKLFEPFFTTKFTGHGLGMSAVLGIVRGHHGAIKVYSEPGRGTTFKVLLPISTEQAEVISSQAVSNDDWGGSGTILIVDDEKTIRETAAMMLEDMGFKTLTATDGIDGVRVYLKYQDDIVGVLMDMTMPKMDGKSCFTELRRINKQVKVILSSGYNEQEATSRFAGQGLAGFIQKPYTPDTLQMKMQQILNGEV